MKKASNILCTIGKVLNVIEIVFAPIIALLGLFIITNTTELFEEFSKEAEPTITSIEELKVMGVAYVIVGIIVLALAITCLVLARNYKKKIDGGDKTNTPGVVFIILGVLSENIFYILTGVLELIALNTKPVPKIVENTDTETKEG